ncbi:hypothetical protein L5G32_10810 [Gordonia sp. HY002]|uniref:hypothetical protein n=1 Tax=Gordonia zhenghanii TaxID=2911516 RepID=UPI001F488BA7|nr:hypothetical protein [Gordonia zhenghanii]MCF8570757.1 hypothetical protein [Gordonia zhenghanii]
MSVSPIASAANPHPSSPRDRRIGRRVIAALTVLPVGAVLALSGCSSDDESAADPGPCAAASSADREGMRPIPVAPADVEVLDTGAPQTGAPQTGAPQTGLLESRPDTTSPQEVTLTTDSIEASIAPADNGNQSVQRTQQQLSTPITARVVCDDPSDLEFTIGTPTTKDAELTPGLDAIAGSEGGLSVADGLQVRSLRLFPNEESGSPARSALEQSFSGALDQSVPLPTEPVGVGARWKSVRIISSAATIRRTTTVTLTGRTGNIVQLAVAVDDVPVDSIFRIPGSAQTLTINRYSMAGTGELTVDLTRVLPIAGSITTEGARELAGDENSAPLLQQNEYTVTWTS